MSPKQNKLKFEQLQADWYEKLKQSGFEDVEQNEEYLKQYSSHNFQSGKNGKSQEGILQNYESKQEYFRRAGQFLYEHAFENDVAKMIWKFHSDGSPYRKIPGQLRPLGIHKSAGQVQRIIYKLEAAMLLHEEE